MKKLKSLYIWAAILVLAIMALTAPILREGYGILILVSQGVCSFGMAHLVWRVLLKKKGGVFSFYGMLFLIYYSVLAVSGQILGSYYGFRLNQFDLDGDDGFSKSEQTAEQRRYMELLTNDVGRNFSIFTGIVYSGIFTILVYFTAKVMAFIRRKWVAKRF